MHNSENTLQLAVASSRLPPSSAATDRMKVFFVGDNRTTVNWGRGASIALGQLLSSSFEITGRVTGDFFDLSTTEGAFVGGFMPPRCYGLFRYLLLRKWRRPFAWYIKLEELLGAKDFIAEDPTVSIDNLDGSQAPAAGARSDLRSSGGIRPGCAGRRWGHYLFNAASPANTLPACDDRTRYSAEKAGLSRKFNDFRLSVDRKK